MSRSFEVLGPVILVLLTLMPQGSSAFIFGRRSDPKIDLMKCKSCSTPLSEENWVQLEKIDKCSPQRRFLQNDILSLDNEFITKRENEVHQFPLACIVHAQRTFTFRTRAKPDDETPKAWSGLDVPGRAYGQCATPESEPVRGSYMPCVTSEYAYSVYNAFHDTVDCFDINGRKLLPKLWNESGFHINTLGGGMDAGVGQLTRSAIEEVLSKPYVNDERTALEVFKQQALNSSKLSCQRLVRQEAAWQAVNPDVSQRCSIMTTPQNPIRNVVYLGVFYKLNERVVESRINSTKMKEKVEALGLENPDMEYFKDAIVTLSFNMGRGSAFSIVDSYLKSRMVNNEKLTAKDLDFLNNSIEEVRALRREPKEETEEDRTKRIARLDAAKETAYKRNLPGFLRLMHGLQADYETDPTKKRINGAPGYLTFVGERQKKYNTDLGDGVCTHASFLQYK
ncbi:MAG: hypothetical protein ACK5V3_12800 [Bdellovibrionales bacterium]